MEGCRNLHHCLVPIDGELGEVWVQDVDDPFAIVIEVGGVFRVPYCVGNVSGEFVGVGEFQPVEYGFGGSINT